MTPLPPPCHHTRTLASPWRTIRHHAALTVYTACAVAFGAALDRSGVVFSNPGLALYVTLCALSAGLALGLLERQRYLAERAWRKRLERELAATETVLDHSNYLAGWACRAAGIRFPGDPAAPGEPDPATRQVRLRHLLRVARSN